jgi:hypothetical protein
MSSAVTFAAVSLIALAVPSAAAASASFRTPGSAAYCGLTEGEGAPGLICWTPNDGFSIAMGRHGRVTHDYNGLDKGYHEPTAPVLAFGRAWSLPHWFRCVSRATGLTCTNDARHGWWLGRYKGMRTF